MARRRILTPAQRSALLALPVDRVEAARHYTLGEAELAAINRRRGGRNRLGFALQLCALRYPGRLLHPGEELPYTMVAFVAEQIGVVPDILGGYAFRPNTKYEHSAALQDILGWRPFEGRPCREIESWLDQASLTTRTGAELAVSFRDELRHRKIIVPGITTIERLCAAALTRCERTVLARLTEGLDRDQSARLDQLLDIGPDTARTWLGWLRQPSRAAGAAAFHATIERLRHVRGIGLEAERERLVPRHHLVRLAREGERLSLSHSANRTSFHGRGRGGVDPAVVRREMLETDGAVEVTGPAPAPAPAMVAAVALVRFRHSPDGLQVELVEVGAIVLVRRALLPGLIAAGLVRPVEDRGDVEHQVEHQVEARVEARVEPVKRLHRRKVPTFRS